MENEKEESGTENPENNTAFLSRLFFVWTIPFFKKILDASFIFNINALPTDSARYLGKKLEDSWEKELELVYQTGSKPSFWNAINRIFGKEKLFWEVIMFFNYVIVRPGLCILLAILIRTFGNDYELHHRYIFGVTFILLTLSMYIIEQFVSYRLNIIGMRTRAAVASLIYRKVLKLSVQSLEKISPEKIMKIATKDLYHFQDIVSFGSKLFICCVQIMLIVVGMWLFIGLPSLTGFLLCCIIILIFPTNNPDISLKIRQHKTEASTLLRIKSIREILAGMKTIKMNNWEKPFEKMVQKTRKSELENISDYLSFQLTFYSFFIHKLCTCLSVITLFFCNGFLLPEQAFGASQFLFLILLSGMYWIPKSVKAHGEIYHTVHSLMDLLLMKEVKILDSLRCDKPEIKVERICTNCCEDEFDLRIEDIKIKLGSLCLIIGPSNSGKSSFLHLLLSEVLPKCGRVDIKGTISYCSQKPWLYASTIRRNITFGTTFTESRYNNVVNSCNLLPDFSQFMNGDKSGIGPDGVDLAEDQKARINLARAVFRDADIYLVDDVLSMMSAEVSSKIFEDCFLGYLARKTRVVVTNQVQFLDKADQIVVIDQGRAQVFDNLSQVKENKIDFYSWMDDQNGRRKIHKQAVANEALDSCDFDHNSTTHQRLNSSEVLEYIKSGDYFSLTCFLLLLTYILITCCDFWMAYWTKETYLRPPSDKPQILSSSPPFLDADVTFDYPSILNYAQTDLIVYSSMVMASILLIALSNGFLINFFVSATRKLHENMSFSVLRTPMKFFSDDSVRRTLRVFADDVKVVDRQFPKASKQTIEIFMFSIGCVVLVYISNIILIFSAFLLVLFVYIQDFYLESSTVLRNLLRTADFPILCHLRDTLRGLPTIRVNEGERKSTMQFEQFLDNHSCLYRLNLACTFSFAMWTTTLCNIFLIFTVVGLILLNEYVHPVDPSYAGLAIIQIVQLTELLQYGSKKFTYTMQDTTSIKRIIDYSKLKEEQALRKKFHDSLEFPSKSKLSLLAMTDYRLTPDNWPEEGVILFRNVTMMYMDKVQALEDVNFKINAQEKVGIVGKLGSGKSSLVAAILNLHDFDGTIIIDKIDTKLIDLECLRQKISVVQDPIMFSESVAYNLDPIGEYSDMELWAVLEEVHLKKYVESLSEIIRPEAKQFTKSQMQLLCLARAILRKNKIVIFDEIASNLDEESQELCYELIKKHFSDCTVLYITSSLSSAVMECDRVLVMVEGKVVDYDHPFSLLESEGAFYKLVSEAGKSVYSRYRQLAYQQYVQKFSRHATK